MPDTRTLSRNQKHMGASADRQPSLLIVEDELDLIEVLRFSLAREGFKVRTATNGEDAIREVRQHKPDLIVLDLMLPTIDGLSVCRALRRHEQTRDIPIVMLTAKGEETDIVKGLEAGADDYVTKPFSPKVLLARIQAVLRRAQPDSSGGLLEVGGVRLDPDRHEVIADGRPVELTATEFNLLRLLMSRPGRVYTRQQIIESIHDGYAAVTDRSVDVQVVSLRRKLGPLGSHVQTVRGVGYRFGE
ncbi:MAG: response regulator transcription factor [Phycisphaeraceae bacterium]